MVQRSLHQFDGEHSVAAATLLVQLSVRHTAHFLTPVKHFKGFLCTFDLHLCGPTHVHVPRGVLTKDTRCRGTEKKCAANKGVFGNAHTNIYIIIL